MTTQAEHIQKYIDEAQAHVRDNGNPTIKQQIMHMRAMAQLVVETKAMYWNRPWEVADSPKHANAVHHYNQAVDKLREMAQALDAEMAEEQITREEINSVQQVQAIQAMRKVEFDKARHELAQHLEKRELSALAKFYGGS